MKIALISVVPVALLLAGCSSAPSCDGAKAQDAVAEVATTNNSQLKSQLSYAFAERHDIQSDAAFQVLDKKMNEDQQKLTAILTQCGSFSSYSNFAENMKDGSNSYDGNKAQYTGQNIDKEAICKRVQVPASHASEDEPYYGETVEVEGDTAFHKAHITPLAYALADDIRKWNEYWDQYQSKQDKAWDEAVKGISYTLSNIIMTAKAQDTGAVQCKATLTGHLDGLADATADITYSIEKNSDGDLVATVYGL